MKSTAEKIDASQFAEDETKRYAVTFYGMVQGVGFRYEIWTIAQKLQLTGYVENLPNGSVYAEIQGAKNKTMYLIRCLKDVPRIQIDKVDMDEIPMKDESTFEIAN